MTKTNYTHRITLRPLSKFFFGGDKSFGSGDDKNYLVKSRYFPQQTALLGLLRWEIIRQDSKLWVGNSLNDAAATAKIGAKSFYMTGTNDFKEIVALSPVFVWDADAEEYFMPIPKDYYCHEIEVEKGMPKQHELTVNARPLSIEEYRGKIYFGDSKTSENQYLFPDFDPKNGIVNALISDKGIISEYEYDKDNAKEPYLFVKKSQIGIDKQKKDEAFYKQTFYGLRENCSFAFFVELGANHGLASHSFVHFGGEQCTFEMKVEPIANAIAYPVFSFTSQHTGLEKIVLQSDAYLSLDIYKYCKLCSTTPISFQNHITEIGKTKQFFNLSKSASDKQSSNQYQFVERGSVFFCEIAQIANLEKELDNSEMQKIGYNHFCKT